ncbi:hypothetical protein VTK56DRAFT_1249 [Thermocarpiscus australiensis]
MGTARPLTARLAILVALFTQLQPALASFWTVTSYYVVTETTSTMFGDLYTYTSTMTVKPTVTPTATPTSSRTSTDDYYDVEVVSLYLPGGSVPESDLVPYTTDDYTAGAFTDYAVPVTYTAPSSCPTPFSVVTYTDVDIPYQVTEHISVVSTATSVRTVTSSNTEFTWYTMFVDRTAVPSSMLNPTSDFYYSYYILNCRNPTATGAAYLGPTYTPHSGGGSSDGSDDDDWEVCAALTGCVAVATWVIVVATILPTIFVLGFVESYCWFRRMMLGKSALRLGTVCWCALSLWLVLLTRRQPARSPQDQALLKQYWATLGAGTRIKLWFKWGFRWKYPVELIGNPDGNNPVVQVAAAPPGQPPQGPGQPMYAPGTDNIAAGSRTDDGAEKTQANVQQQPAYMPYPGPYMQPGQPSPGQPYPAGPGFPPPQQGYIMPMQPQSAYMGPQGFVTTTPPAEGQQPPQQPVYPPYVPSPSPVQTVQTNTTAVPSNQPTPPPHLQQQPPSS